jgi:hypothetical protein
LRRGRGEDGGAKEAVQDDFQVEAAVEVPLEFGEVAGEVPGTNLVAPEQVSDIDLAAI